MHTLLLKTFALLIIPMVFATTALAAPITQAYPFLCLINSNLSSRSIYYPRIVQYVTIGAGSVIPNAIEGTTGEAKHSATGDVITLRILIDSGRPSYFDYSILYEEVLEKGYLTPWEITLTNGPDSRTIYTPDRTGAQMMELAENLTITGSGTDPLFSWDLPTTGAPVSIVAFELWNAETWTIENTEHSIYLGSNVKSLKLSDFTLGLTLGQEYAVRIMPVHQDQTGWIARSDNWFEWEATESAASGYSVQLTTQSNAGILQNVNTPNEPVYMKFDYRFTTTTGLLTIYLNGVPIGSAIEAPETIYDNFHHAVFKIDKEWLLNLTDVPLFFELEGERGSTVLLDNIVFPGLANGDFEYGLESWELEGPGLIAVRPFREPIPMLEEALMMINDFPVSTFKNRQMSRPLTNMINSVLKMIENGLYEKAIDALNDILKKTDGCAISGYPDRNDWIMDCDSQSDLYPLINDAMKVMVVMAMI